MSTTKLYIISQSQYMISPTKLPLNFSISWSDLLLLNILRGDWILNCCKLNWPLHTCVKAFDILLVDFGFSFGFSSLSIKSQDRAEDMFCFCPGKYVSSFSASLVSKSWKDFLLFSISFLLWSIFTKKVLMTWFALFLVLSSLQSW